MQNESFTNYMLYYWIKAINGLCTYYFNAGGAKGGSIVTLYIAVQLNQ